MTCKWCNQIIRYGVCMLPPSGAWNMYVIHTIIKLDHFYLHIIVNILRCATITQIHTHIEPYMGSSMAFMCIFLLQVTSRKLMLLHTLCDPFSLFIIIASGKKYKRCSMCGSCQSQLSVGPSWVRTSAASLFARVPVSLVLQRLITASSDKYFYRHRRTWRIL